MNMKVIAISQRIEKSKYNEIRCQLDIRLIDFIVKCGLVPTPIPYFSETKKNSNYHLKKWIESHNLGGIVLSGGSDIGENRIRDNSEKYLLKYSLKNNIPVIGICRGMQMIGKFFGIKLKKVKGHVNKDHFVYSSKDKVKVNSYHNYSIKSCPINFKILYKTLDGNIEAMISKNKRIYGCMWHPERNRVFNEKDVKIFKTIFRKP